MTRSSYRRTSIGVDLGFTRANPMAVALIDPQDGQLLDHHEILPRYKLWHRNIHYAGQQFTEWLEALAQPPELVGCEIPIRYHGRGVTTYGKLFAFYYEVLRIGHELGIPVKGVKPAEAKKALTGNGRASKDDMIKMAELRTGVCLSKDEADAFAVALATSSPTSWEEAA